MTQPQTFRVPTSSNRSADTRQTLLDRYRRTRALSLELCSHLQPEDFRIQSMPDVSPPWWNLGHTTWFFAKNVLEPQIGGGPAYQIPAELDFALNSYYEAFGQRVERHRRGLLTRPTTQQILDFRREVDEQLGSVMISAPDSELERLDTLINIGIHHEQQHQELLVTELKHIFFSNPPQLRPHLPIQLPGFPPGTSREAATVAWLSHQGGLVECGADGESWCWDNELPRHRRYLEPFQIADRLVTVSLYQEFIADGGYHDPLLWLANGWAFVTENRIEAPLYWLPEDTDGTTARQLFTLAGTRTLHPAEPVCHVSFYEADAFANWLSHQGEAWRGVRLPTEFEWEAAAENFDQQGANLMRAGQQASEHQPTGEGDFLAGSPLHPLPVNDSHRGSPLAAATLHQSCGDLWEWTSSHYEPYPGYRPFAGDLMEYNGKFMDNQRILRGGSCATPVDHLRRSYRNFWHATTRFQFSGLRLARSLA